MKKTMIIVLLAVIFSQWVSAKDYAPFVKQGKQWVYYRVNPSLNGAIFIRNVFTIDGDTVVNGRNYSKLYHDNYTVDGSTIEHSIKLYALLREEDGSSKNARVYARRVYEHTFPPFIGIITGELVYGYGYEYLIYDWEKDPNEFYDTVPMSVNNRTRYFRLNEKSEIEINGTLRDCYSTDCQYRHLIEGLGFVQTNYEPVTGYNPAAEPYAVPFRNFIHLNPLFTYILQKNLFSHLIEDGEVVYKGDQYDFFIENDYIAHHSGNVAVDDIEAAKPALTDGAYYDMQGRRMTEPAAPGIYIKDGKKVVVK